MRQSRGRKGVRQTFRVCGSLLTIDGMEPRRGMRHLIDMTARPLPRQRRILGSITQAPALWMLMSVTLGFLRPRSLQRLHRQSPAGMMSWLLTLRIRRPLLLTSGLLFLLLLLPSLHLWDIHHPPRQVTTPQKINRAMWPPLSTHPLPLEAYCISWYISLTTRKVLADSQVVVIG